jgi:regulation of enolase protein 1 (concanavalin A-like superfamily)
MVQPVYRLDTGRLVNGTPTPFVLDTNTKTVARDLGKAAGNLPVAGFAALGSLIDALGQPAKDCKVEKEGSSLTIEVPAGVRVLSPQLDVHTAPLMLTDVEGDFIAQVRVTGNMIPGTSPPKFKGRDNLPNTYQGAGLVLLQDSRNYIRVERSVSAERGKPTLRTRALIEIVKGGRVISVLYPRIPDGDLYIRIQRTNGAVTCLFGPNGKFWLTHEKLAIAIPPKIKVGLIASNMSKVPLNAQFEQFVLITEKKDVDAEKSEQ